VKPVSATLGHSNVNSTLGIYSHAVGPNRLPAQGQLLGGVAICCTDLKPSCGPSPTGCWAQSPLEKMPCFIHSMPLEAMVIRMFTCSRNGS
jgi:hypothetical protein